MLHQTHINKKSINSNLYLLVMRRDYSSYFNCFKVFLKEIVSSKNTLQMLQNTVASSLSLILFLDYVWIFHQILKDFSIRAVF